MLRRQELHLLPPAGVGGAPRRHGAQADSRLLGGRTHGLARLCALERPPLCGWRRGRPRCCAVLWESAQRVVCRAGPVRLLCKAGDAVPLGPRVGMLPVPHACRCATWRLPMKTLSSWWVNCEECSRHRAALLFLGRADAPLGAGNSIGTFPRSMRALAAAAKRRPRAAPLAGALLAVWPGVARAQPRRLALLADGAGRLRARAAVCHARRGGRRLGRLWRQQRAGGGAGAAGRPGRHRALPQAAAHRHPRAAGGQGRGAGRLAVAGREQLRPSAVRTTLEHADPATLLQAGETGYINDSIALHAVRVPEHCEGCGAVTLHLYAPPIRCGSAGRLEAGVGGTTVA